MLGPDANFVEHSFRDNPNRDMRSAPSVTFWEGYGDQNGVKGPSLATYNAMGWARPRLFGQSLQAIG